MSYCSSLPPESDLCISAEKYQFSSFFAKTFLPLNGIFSIVDLIINPSLDLRNDLRLTWLKTSPPPNQ
jgi:hypothetical protein